MIGSVAQLDGPLTRIARTFARDRGVEVIVAAGEAPRADLAARRIYLPATVDYASDEARQAWEGMLDHEVAHIAEEVAAEAAGTISPMAVLAQCTSPIERLYFNVFEDVRIEIAASQRWPGVAENLEALAAYSLPLLAAAWGRGGLRDPHFAIGVGIVARSMRREITGLPLDVLAALDQLQPEIEAARSLSDPVATLTIARRSLAKIWAMDASPGKRSGEALEGARTSAAAAAGAMPVGSGDRPAGGRRAAADRDLDGAADPDDGPDLLTTDLGAVVRAGLESATVAEVQLDPRRVLVHPKALAADRVIVPGDAPEAYAEAAAKARPQAEVLTTKLVRWLRAQVDDPQRDQESGRIDSTALAGLVTSGDRRIFETDGGTEDRSAAVIVLVDESGSMAADARWWFARQAAVAIGWALHRCAVPFEILGWTDVRCGLKKKDLAGGYTRIEAQQVLAYKAFADRFPLVCQRLGGISDRQNNDDASALLMAARRLLRRDEARKILILLSDGMPSHMGPSSVVQLADVVRRIRATGVEIGAVGICSDHVRSFYQPHVVVVPRLEDLAIRTVELFKQMCQNRGS